MLLNTKFSLSFLRKQESIHEKMDPRFRGDDEQLRHFREERRHSRESGNPSSKLKQWLWFIGLYAASLIFLGLVMFALRHLVFLLP